MVLVGDLSAVLIESSDLYNPVSYRRGFGCVVRGLTLIWTLAWSVALITVAYSCQRCFASGSLPRKSSAESSENGNLRRPVALHFRCRDITVSVSPRKSGKGGERCILARKDRRVLRGRSPFWRLG